MVSNAAEPTDAPSTEGVLCTANDFQYPDGWTSLPPGQSPADRARHYCRQLEAGRVVYLPTAPFDLPADDREFLLAQRQSEFKGHKNVSYRPRQDRMRGAAPSDPAQGERLHDVMRRFSKQVTQFLTRFLAPYAPNWKMDFASFRPLEEKGRPLSLHKRNDLVHVDSFPSRPTNGGQILRVFTNINPDKARVWNVTDPFPVIARKYAQEAGLDSYARSAVSAGRRLRKIMAPALRPLGVRNFDRSPYDQFMLHFHDWLKESSDYQDHYPKTRIEFPPGSTWMVFTDVVPHAVTSGQFMLEQTYIIPMEARVTPESAPMRVLESLCGTALAR